MPKVSGIGGFFFRSQNPGALAAWYQTHFGISLVPDDYDTPPWRQEAGETVFAPFPKDTEYFGQADKQWMINFRTPDLDALLVELRAAGIEVTLFEDPQPNGRFAHLRDPEGNPIELWEPA